MRTTRDIRVSDAVSKTDLMHYTRSLVRAYQFLDKALNQTDIGHRLYTMLYDCADVIRTECAKIASRNRCGDWATEHIGPVLAAGMTATTDMRHYLSERSMLRCFGIDTTPSLSPIEAWELVKPYRYEPVLAEDVIAQIFQTACLIPRNLAENPSPADVLSELTRPRSAEFLSQMARWIIRWFIRESWTEGHYYKLYQESLERQRKLNLPGQIEKNIVAAIKSAKSFSAEDWKCLLDGRLPESTLEFRAALSTTRQFLLDYYQLARKNP